MNPRNSLAVGALVLAAAGAVFAQAPPKPYQAKSSSTFSYGSKDGSETVEITNFAYELAGDSIPGRPPNSRLALRTTTQSTQVIGDKGVEASVTMEAWPLGVDFQRKPLYSVKVAGVGAQTLDGALWVADRGVDPDVAWWSVYKLGTGEHLLDTYVDLLKFSISREEWKQRYVGLEVPPDDTRDARLKDPRVVTVLTYASAEKVIREVVVTCDDRKRAVELRSYADSTRTLVLTERAPGQPAIRLSFSRNYPSTPNAASVSIPVVKDELDLTHAELPAGFHVAAFRR